MYQATAIEVIFCLIVWLIAIFIYLPSIKCTGKGLCSKYPSSKIDSLLLLSLITLYSVFEFAGGDFYHYKEFYDLGHSKGADDGLDPIYLWLIDIIPNNFYLWRLIIWGSAAYIWLRIIKRLNYSVRLAGCMFFLVVFYLFVGARQALAFSLLYYGLTIFLTSYKTIDKVVGFLIFLLSYYFHSTMIVYMILSLLALLPFSKKYFIFSILLFPFIYEFFGGVIDNFVSQLSLFNKDSSDTIMRYLESDFRVTYNLKGLIRLCLDRLPIFLLLIVSIKDVYWKKLQMQTIYKYFLQMSYILIYISYLFVGREVSAFIAPRFWDAALFPLTLFLAGYLPHTKSKRLIFTAVLFLILSKLFTFFLVFNKSI